MSKLSTIIPPGDPLLQPKATSILRHFAFRFMIGFWLLLGLIDLLKSFIYTANAGIDFDWGSSLQFVSFYCLAWFLLSFPIYELFQRTAHLNWQQRALLHSIASIIFGGLHVLITSFSFFLCDTLMSHHVDFWEAYFAVLTGRMMPAWLDRSLTYWMVAIILLAFDYYEKFRKQTTLALQLESELSQAQLQALRMQVQPHFLFNAHNTIAMLIRGGKHTAAVDMLSGLSDMLRTALTQENDQFITLKHEIHLIEKYLNIEKARFEERLSVHVEVDQETSSALVPSLILQPLVENAIKHGVAREMNKAEIRISATRNKGELVIVIYNSGPALPADWSLEDSKGIGLQNVRRRLQTLYPETSNLELINAPGGVEARIHIPYTQ